MVARSAPTEPTGWDMVDIKRQPWRIVRWAILVIVALWLLATAWILISARGALGDAADSLDDLSDASLTDLFDGRVVPAIDRAADDVDRARGLLGSVVLEPWRAVPVASRHLGVVRADARTAEEVLAAGRTVAIDAEAVAGAESPAARAAALAALADSMAGLHASLPDDEVGDAGPLFPPLRGGHRALYTKVDELREVLDDGTSVVATVSRLASGPTRLLLLGANNAEMRSGHGTILSWSVVEIHDGAVTTVESRPIGTFPAVDDPLALIDPEVLANWGWLDLTNPADLGATGRSDATLATLGARYETATGAELDGVVLIDSKAISRLGEEVGPLRTSGPSGSGHLPDDEILDYLLHDQYEAIEDFEDLSPNAERREATSDLVSVIAERLFSGDADLPDVLDALRDVRDGRHLLVLTDEDQSTWDSLGVSAVLRPEEWVVGAVNAGANKIDQYLDTTVTVDHDDDGVVTVRVTVRNDRPDDDLPYVVGIEPDETPEGAHATMFTLTLPVGAALDGPLDLPEGAILAAGGVEAGRSVLGVRFDLAHRASASMTVRFRPDPGVGQRPVPTARVPETTWIVDGDEVDVRQRGG